MHGSLYDVVMAPLERLSLTPLRRRLWRELRPEGLGLEVGAGTGVNFPLHPPGARVVAVDASCAMLGRARGKPGAEATLLVACDVEALPFREQVFDWGAETLVFCEVRRPDVALCEIARVLARGASWLMLEHVRPAGVLGIAADLFTRLSAPLWGEHFDRSPEPALAEAGFTIARAEAFGRGVLRLLACRAPGPCAARERASAAAPGPRV